MSARLVRAAVLPASFDIETTWHERARARVLRAGGRILVTIMGCTLSLTPRQRVRVAGAAARASVRQFPQFRRGLDPG